MRWLLLLCAGCQAADPCDGKAAVCLTVTVEGQGIRPLDRISAAVTHGSETVHGLTQESSAISLPVRFAARLRADFTGDLLVRLEGMAATELVAAGESHVLVPASGHAPVTVTLLGAQTLADLAGVDFTGVDFSGVDLTPPPLPDLALQGGLDLLTSTLTLSPNADQLLKIPAGAHITKTFTATASGGAPVHLNAMSLTPMPPGLSLVTPAVNPCIVGSDLPAGQSCDIVVEYAPTGPQSAATTVRLDSSGGSASAILHVSSPGWADESQAGGKLSAVFALDALHAIAVGDAGRVLVRDDFGWTAHNVPATPNLTAVWARNAGDIYAVGGSAMAFHTTNGGVTWDMAQLPLTKLTSSVTSLGSFVYVGGTDGDIVVGAWGAWTADRAANSVPVTQLTAFGGAPYAVNDSGTLTRTTTWVSGFSDPGLSPRAIFGTSSSDLIVAGVQVGCLNPGCGILYHFDGVNHTSAAFATCNSFNGVWHDGTSYWAVGDGGFIEDSTNGTGWNGTTLIGGPRLIGVHGAGGDLYVVGDNGVIFHHI